MEYWKFLVVSASSSILENALEFLSTRGLLRIGSLGWVKNLLKLFILANLKDSWVYQLDLSSCLMLLLIYLLNLINFQTLGGLGIGKISQEVDIWTISKSTQLLSSRDNMISSIANRQLLNTLNCAIGHDHEIPLTEFLSVSQTHGLYGYRFYSKGANLWTRTRHAATHLGARIDISDGNIIIAIDDICSTPAKIVKSMRLALRKKWSRTFVELPLQGSVAECLSQNANSKVITKLISQESTLSFKFWNYLHMARTQTLPVKAFPGSTYKKCRQCYSKKRRCTY